MADVDAGAARKVRQGPTTLRGSYPRTEGGANLNRAAGDRLVYQSYEDGWSHLPSVPAGGGSPIKLTDGHFMVEYVARSPDRRSVVYNANAGDAPDDMDRRHLFKVPADRPASVARDPRLPALSRLDEG